MAGSVAQDSTAREENAMHHVSPEFQRCIDECLRYVVSRRHPLIAKLSALAAAQPVRIVLPKSPPGTPGQGSTVAPPPYAPVPDTRMADGRAGAVPLNPLGSPRSWS